MFNNDRFSDVKFVVRKMDGESESKYVIPAHKFVLSISSPVFEAMFYGELAETKDSIELPDCEYESLLELFRFMYSDEVNLSGSNVMGVLYLAKKYMVPSLAHKCTDFLQDNLDASNAFGILPKAYHFDEKKLVERCWKVIDERCEEALKSDGFATLERSLLEEVVKRDTLNIEEVELFKAVDSWASKKCKEEGLTAYGDVKRKVLGENIVKAIRFPVMKQQDFAGVVLDTKILTKDEICDVVKYLNSVLSSPVGFPIKKRWIMCTEGGLSRPISRQSTDISVNYPSVDYPSVDDVGRLWSTNGRLSVDHPSTIGPLSTDSRPTTSRLWTDSRPTTGRQSEYGNCPVVTPKIPPKRNNSKYF